MSKYKMTGCARFFIFLLILGPIAYFGARYLMDSGKFDQFKDKIEGGSSNSVERAIESKKSGSDDPTIIRLENQLERVTNAYKEQEETLKNQKITIENQRQEIEQLKKRSGSLGGVTTSSSGGTLDNGTASPSTSSSPTTNSPSTGSSSLDDLLKEADSNLGTSSGSKGTTQQSAGRETLGNWRFNLSGTQGKIEFYQDRGKLLSKITIDGNGQMSIDELTRSGDRFTVIGSPTGEYYLLKRNGDLDAYDRNGYQTTCKRS